MDTDYSDLINIQIFYEIFTKNSIVEYNFEKQQSQTQKKGIAYLSNNSIILPQFYQINFESMILYVYSKKDTLIDLNPNNNLQQLIFYDTEFLFLSNTSLQIANTNILIFDKLTIDAQPSNITNKQFFIIKNVNTIYINNLTIKNFESQHQILFLFQQVENININNLNLLNLKISGDLFKFLECQNISINHLNLSKITINKGNIFLAVQQKSIQINGIKANQVKYQPTPANKRNLNLEQLQSTNNIPSNIIFNIQGCQNVEIQDSYFDDIQDICLIYANHYSVDSIQMYFFNNIQIIDLEVKNFHFSANQDQMLQITSIQAALQNINMYEVTNQNSLLLLSPLGQVIISDSTFKNINLLSGSTIELQQGQLIINNTNFTDIHSAGDPSALNVLQGDNIQIIKSNFINLASMKSKTQNSQTQQLQLKGGAITFLNTKVVKLQQSLFKNCKVQEYGGAIYSSQSKQQTATFEIYQTQFIENQSFSESGGAIYFLYQTGINITESYFLKNTAQGQKGGALYFESSQILSLQKTNFTLNQAKIGGSIYYQATNSDLFQKSTLLINQVFFLKNEASFYGQNIGSIPFWIGISEIPKMEKLQITDKYIIHNISSGNYLDKTIYLNFFDEERNPFNFKIQSNQNSAKSQFYLQLYYQNNSEIIIQQGANAQLNETTGFFELNFQSIYKGSQKQNIYITSNQIDQDKQLYLPLELQFRDCIQGETISEKDEFIQCNQCVSGRYSLKIPDMQKDINNLQCTSCPSEANFCMGSQIILRNGYWRENEQTDKIYKCLLDSCSVDNPQNKFGCLEGFVGPLCNSCDSKGEVWEKQYGLKQSNCYVCSQWIEQYLYFSLYFALYFLYIAYSHHNMIKSKILMQMLIIFKKIDLLITSKSSSKGQDFSLWFKIFINYLQILSFMLSFNISIPSFFDVSLNIFGDPIQLTITSFDCLAKMTNKYPVWLNRIVTQIVSMVSIYLLINLSLLLVALKQYKDQKMAISQIPKTAKMTFIFIYIFYQPSISKMLIQGIFCIQIGDNSYLISDYSQQCNTYYHILYTLTITFPLIIIWCFFIPLVLFLKLRSLQKLDNHKNIKSHKIQNLLTYGILYDGYKTKFMYWEILKFFHKLILMVVINLNINLYIQISIILITTILYFFLLTQNQPHKNVQQFETEKQLVYNLLYSYALLLIMISDTSQLQIYKKFAFILIAFINITTIKIAFFIFTGQIIIQIDEENSCQNNFKRFLLKIKNKYPNFFQFLNFRKTKMLRVHQLWKKVIISFRQNIFTSNNFQLVKTQTKQLQSEYVNKNLNPIIQNTMKNDQYVSSNILFNSSAILEKLKINLLLSNKISLHQCQYSQYNFKVFKEGQAQIHLILLFKYNSQSLQSYIERQEFASKGLFKHV